MTLSHGLAAVFLAALVASPEPQVDPVPAVDAFVRAEIARQRIPGVAVGVVKGGKVLVSRGFGLANVEHTVPVTDETIFQSGSVGKMFTSAAVMLLVEDGKIALSDPIARFFPGAPASWRGITVRHLLSHTSGIADYANSLDLRKDYTEEQLTRMAFGMKLGFTPGEKWQYSNTGYLLLGFIVRKASGTFYGDAAGGACLQAARDDHDHHHQRSRHRAAPRRGLHAGEGGVEEPVLGGAVAEHVSGRVALSLGQGSRGVGRRRPRRPGPQGRRAGPGLRARAAERRARPTATVSAGSSVVRGGQPVYQHGGSWQGFKTHYTRFDRGDLSVIALANLTQADTATIVDGIAALLDPALAPAR